MRDGRISGAIKKAEAWRDAGVDQMIGTKASRNQQTRPEPVGEVALEARVFTVLDASGKEVVSHLDLFVKRREIVGLFGLLGSGMVEATMALFGAWRGEP